MRCKKDSTTNPQARYDRLTKMYEHMLAECLRRGRQLEVSFTTIQRLQDELNHIKRTTPTTVGLLNEKQRLQDENDVLHAHFDTLERNYDRLYDEHQATLKELNSLKEVRELNLRAYDDLLTTHQRTLKELKDYKDHWTTWVQPEPTTTYLGKPLEYWAELQNKYINVLTENKNLEQQNRDIRIDNKMLLNSNESYAEENRTLQGRIDKANDQLCAFRNLFADGV